MKNINLDKLDIDFLYHLGLDTDMDLKNVFGDVKYVCMMGSADRTIFFANKLAEKLNIPLPGGKVEPIGKTERCSLCKVGSVIAISHGMGIPSVSIFLHEVTKLLEYAGCIDDVTYFRIGTSGGLGVDPGTVIITDEVISEKLEPYHEKILLGKTYKYPTKLNEELSKEIMNVRGDIPVIIGKTMCTNDFYEGQARLDGAFKPPYTKENKMNFIEKIHNEFGVKNIEMESAEFAAFCIRASIPAAIACVAIVNRLKGDQITSTPEELANFSDNAQTIIINYIKRQLT